MKRIYFLGSLAFLSLLMIVTGCSDEFLNDKTVYGKFGEDQVYGNFTSAQERVNYLYYSMMPISGSGSGNGSSGMNDYTSTGYNDPFAKSTLEYGGFSDYVDPSKVLDYTNVADYFYVINKNVSPWGNIRDCNDVIEKLNASTALTAEQKKQLLGQAYFMRAYRYWALVKMYGGVPIINYVQDPVVGGGDGSDKVIPRSSTKDCITFICGDLQKAADMLPARWENANSDFGRITSGAAEAVKGSVQLFYASPLFNRADDKARWDSAYASNKEALTKLQSGNFGLAYASSGGTQNAANWARIFMNYTGSETTGGVCEAVLISMFNNHDKVDANLDKWNGWEHSIRPANSNGGGGLHPTSEMIDLFPMADGKRPGASTIDYDKLLFWMNRDPRFYRTFAFPGEEWRFNQGSANLGDNALASIYPVSIYPNGSDYKLWSYTWYDKDADAPDPTVGMSAGFSPEKLNTKNSAVYVRKKTDDAKLTETPLYKFSISSTTPKGFQQSAAPVIVMRYAEVLLNFAEAACGAGHYDEALTALQQIRARVGYTAENNFGLDAGINGDRAKLFAAILYERQIELAYEGKSFDDTRRWMLFDGGSQTVAGAPTSWKLSGFGGNTCNYLGVSPLNGQKRHEVVLYSQINATEAEANDPIVAKRPLNSKGLTYALDLAENITTAGRSSSDLKVENMCLFYTNNLKRKDMNSDGNNETFSILFRPEYYFLGLKQSAQSTNPSLYQNIGWHDYSHGSDGTFDPLAE